jgi:hypothetical protein
VCSLLAFGMSDRFAKVAAIAKLRRRQAAFCPAPQSAWQWRNIRCE